MSHMGKYLWLINLLLSQQLKEQTQIIALVLSQLDGFIWRRQIFYIQK